MKEIPLTQGKVAIVDDEDYADLIQFKWQAWKHRRTWYARRYAGTRPGTGKYRSVVHEYMHSRLLPDAEQVDHRNGDGLDNRRENLRPATREVNARNRRRQVTNVSGYVGVRRGLRGRWNAFINVSGKYIDLGRFDDPVAAAHARDDAVRRYHGEAAALNFPNPGERGVNENPTTERS